MAIENWSTTAGSNNSAPPNGAPEGQTPGSVNDVMREIMAQVRRWAQQIVTAHFATDTGSADAYVIAPAIAAAAYTTGAVYWFKAANANTGASTLNVNSLGTKTIKKFTSSGVADVAAGDIKQNQIVAVVYDGTNMVMISPVASLTAAGSETLAGLLELATQAEVNTGTDTARAITPAGLTGWTPAVGTVTFDPAADKVLLADGSASGVLKQGLIVRKAIQFIDFVVAEASGSTTFPDDDTAPASGEGTQLATQAITLAAAANKVRVSGLVFVGGSTSGADAVVAVFRGTTNILSVGPVRNGVGALGGSAVAINCIDAPGSVGPHTYSLRIGLVNSSAGTWTAGTTSTARFGDTQALNTVTLTEFV